MKKFDTLVEKILGRLVQDIVKRENKIRKKNQIGNRPATIIQPSGVEDTKRA